jgi:hypothetical protein
MTSKIADLENQIGTLEMFLANSEIQYVAGEIDDELHASESSAFSSGLDAVKKQLVAIKEVVTSLHPYQRRAKLRKHRSPKRLLRKSPRYLLRPRLKKRWSKRQ